MIRDEIILLFQVKMPNLIPYWSVKATTTLREFKVAAAINGPKQVGEL